MLLKSVQWWRHTIVGLSLSTMAIFSIFSGYFLDTLEIRPVLLHGDKQSVVDFSVIPKCMTFNGYFALNSVIVGLAG